MFGKGQVGGFLIPQNKVNQLIKSKDWLTTTQKKQIMEALQNGGQIIIKPTKQPSGGIPMFLNALSGKDYKLTEDQGDQYPYMFLPKTVGWSIHMQCHPLFLTYDQVRGNQIGRGKKGHGLLLG